MHEQSDDRITYIATTNHRNAGVRFGIKQRDRRSHFYITGKTGTGKSHLLRIMLTQDIVADQGCALFDPHGDLVQDVRAQVPKSRLADLVYLDVPNTSVDWRFNPLSGVAPEHLSLAAAGMVEAFKNLWTDDWGPRLEHLLRNTIFTLLETPSSTLADIPPLLTDKTYRNSLVYRLKNAAVQDFWTTEFDRYSPAFRAVVTAPLQNKIGALLTDPILHTILSSVRNFL